ncbi:hypothetical protein TanjilG_23537 [Lupinus angustifolius]|uniref:Protodermal factor 1 n=1 Tax=Lupinus angustifolius TaxID=3871 RepID=A0A4P1R9T2_LUPAN|nr:PREDICTED: protodermal factor 1-like [Lupinus angustifolius]OIW05751.1 hypothetical protein TanjilG_23537 [Lupinus angustifolius]
MEWKRSHVSLTMFAMLAGLFSHNNLVICSTSVEDQKNYYYPDPNAGTPPSHGTPSTPSGGNCGSPPPPPPRDPSTPTTPSNPPSGGGGGYYNSPPSPPYGGGSPPTPTIPIDPGTPNIPSPPFFPSPSPFTGTCNYWSSHPRMIWGLLGWWGTLGNAFGFPGSGSGLTLPQALSNTRTDGVGALYREGTASYLNSLVNNKFPYTTNQVRDRFVASLSSNKAATTQAKLFKMANEASSMK